MSLLLLLAATTALALDRRTGLIAQETPAATPYYIEDSGVAGPTVLIVGGVHGNEPAGAYAADEIRHWPVKRGKLVVVPRANVTALAANKRLSPGVATNLSNLARDFPHKPGPETARGDLATALWTFVRQQHPAWVLDLHEGIHPRAAGTNSVGSSVIIYPAAETETAATAMLAAVNASVTNRLQQFVLLRQPVAGSLARAAGDWLGANAMTVETSIAGQRLPARARQHRLLVQVLLARLGLLDDSVSAEWLTEHSARLGQTAVALYDAEGSAGKGVPNVLALLGRETNVNVVCVGPEDIRAGALSQFDVVIFTGGSGSGQAASLGPEGRDRVKRFVEAGGGYIGICAGAYLPCDGFSWGLGILNARTASPKWQRGNGTVKLELTEQGRTILADLKGTFDCHYAQGPILRPGPSAALPPYEPLAYFRTELAENNTPKGLMVDSPAIVASPCGKGRVLCFSPHPELTAGLEFFVTRAVAWVARHGEGSH